MTIFNGSNDMQSNIVFSPLLLLFSKDYRLGKGLIKYDYGKEEEEEEEDRSMLERR